MLNTVPRFTLQRLSLSWHERVITKNRSKLLRINLSENRIHNRLCCLSKSSTSFLPLYQVHLDVHVPKREQNGAVRIKTCYQKTLRNVKQNVSFMKNWPSQSHSHNSSTYSARNHISLRKTSKCREIQRNVSFRCGSKVWVQYQCNFYPCPRTDIYYCSSHMNFAIKDAHITLDFKTIKAARFV